MNADKTPVYEVLRQTVEHEEELGKFYTLADAEQFIRENGDLEDFDHHLVIHLCSEDEDG